MKYNLTNIDNNVEVCFVYIDDLDDNLKEFIDKNFLEIIKGKKIAERELKNFNIDSLRDAAKYIIEKNKTTSAKVGIIGVNDIIRM